MKKSYKNILLIDLAFIGDVLLAVPTMRAIKEAYPKAKLTLMLLPLTAKLARLIPYVDDVIVYDKFGADSGFFSMFKVAERLKPYKFDLSICMNFAPRGAIVSMLANIPERLGYDAQHAGFFLTMTASSKRDGIKHETLNHLEVLKPLGITTQDTSIELVVPQSVKESYQKKREMYGIPSGNYVVICPFGSYEKKSLFTTTAIHLAKRWHNAHKRVYLIGGFDEGEALEMIARSSGVPYLQVLAGKLTLSELILFLRASLCLVTVDTGPMHIAAVAGCPTVAVFGPTDPVVWGPRGKEDVVLYKNPGCSPCWGKGKCAETECMANITALDIARAVEDKGIFDY